MGNKGRNRARAALAGLALGSLAACAPVELHEVPPAKPAHAASPAVFGFHALSADIPRGRVIGSIYWNPFGCALAVTPEITWSSSRFLTEDVEIADAFHRVFKGAGFNVVGDPSEIFQPAGGRRTADFRVAGRLTDVRINICAERQFFTGIATGRESGEASVVIDWQVYSSVTRSVVMKLRTTGKADQGQPLIDAQKVLMVEAFADAAERLAASGELAALLRAPIAPPPQGAAAGLTKISVPRLRLYGTPIAEHMEAVIGATVMVRHGGGHGSGFFISGDGLVLTNNHVVTDAREVSVQLRSGVEITGEVVRRDPRRDVALVKVPVKVQRPMSLRLSPARVGEDVYVVGTPLDPAHQSTVTRGIVSKLRHSADGPLIQSDVTTHKGNSGGPMLDRHGNVIGITVAGFVNDQGGEANLNLFIPVADALEKLNIGFTGPAAP